MGAKVAVVGATVARWVTGCSTVTVGGTVSGATSNLLSTTKSQGFLRVGVANEPPYTQVSADEKVTGGGPVCRSARGRSTQPT